jgi:hypothetical protein
MPKEPKREIGELKKFGGGGIDRCAGVLCGGSGISTVSSGVGGGGGSGSVDILCAPKNLSNSASENQQEQSQAVAHPTASPAWRREVVAGTGWRRPLFLRWAICPFNIEPPSRNNS